MIPCTGFLMEAGRRENLLASANSCSILLSTSYGLQQELWMVGYTIRVRHGTRPVNDSL